MSDENNDNQEPPKSLHSSDAMVAASSELDEKARLELAHELYMNEDMQMSMPSPDSLYGHVKEIVQRAFWDSLRDGLEKSPPEFEHCLKLLEEMKGVLVELVPAGAASIRSQVNEVMDMTLYRQQIQQQTFDVGSVVKFVVDIMLMLCAPARDPSIRSILSKREPVELFKEVFSALDLMRLDMVNYQLRTLRPQLLATGVQYEQDKFRALLANNPRALDNTKLWIEGTVQRMRRDNQNTSPSSILNTAFIRLLEEQVAPVPETVSMDEARFLRVSRELSAVVFSAVCINVLQSGVGPVVQTDAFANKVRVTIYQLCSDELINHPRDILPHITEKLLDVVKETVTMRPLTDEECHNVRGILSVLQAADNPVYCLIWQRAKQYFVSLCSGSVGSVPGGFSVCSSDLQGVASKYTHLVSYNRGVFGPFYADIISQATAQT